MTYPSEQGRHLAERMAACNTIHPAPKQSLWNRLLRLFRL